jgi:hypothetical protein
MVGAPGPSALVPHGSQMGTSGGRCRRYRQHPLGGTTIDISNFGGARCWTCCQHPQEAHRRHLQHRWWPLPDLPPVPPGGPPSRSSTSVVADVRPAASTPLGAHHQRLQLRWWLLPDLPPAPPQEGTIDVSNFSGGRCWTYRQHLLGGPPSTSPTSGPLAPSMHDRECVGVRAWVRVRQHAQGSAFLRGELRC